MIIVADARALPLADKTIQCVVTSPPYWGLRNYGVDGQIGLEPTPEAYVATMVEVFREVSRVLKDDGTVWLNLGDSYAGSWGNQGRKEERGTQRPINGPMMQNLKPYPERRSHTGSIPKGSVLKPKDLVGIPWRVAFALQADGWYLRSDIIWAKPNPMPESVRDRPTRSHEYMFLLTKSEKYYYDSKAIAEPLLRPDEATRKTPGKFGGALKHGGNGTRLSSGNEYHGTSTGTKNKRDVWFIAPHPYRGAHFATFPEALVEPCILAGSKPGDVILDPFLGSGTVGAVAQRLNRSWVGTELNRDYCELARNRTGAQVSDPEEFIAAF